MDDRLGFQHHPKKIKILYFSTLQSPQNNHKRNWNNDLNRNWKWQTCVDNERGTIGGDGTWAWPHSYGFIPLVWLQNNFEIEPMNEMFGDSMRPRHVWTPQWHRLVVLVKQMVVALIVIGTCITNCQTYVGTKMMKNWEIQTETETERSPWCLAPNKLVKKILGLCCNNRNCYNS